MVKVTPETMRMMRRRRSFDEEADWVPLKNRRFVMKAPKPVKQTTDAEGLDQAYASPTNLYLDPEGTLHVSGTKGGFLGKEWIENYRYFGPGLVERLGKLMTLGQLTGKDEYDVEAMGRYKEVDDFIKAHPGQVKNFTGHSKGAAVVDKWMKNHPEFTGKARLYNTPYEDITGAEGWKDRLNEARLSREEYFKDKFVGPDWLGRTIKTVEDTGQNILEKVTGLDQVKGMEERGEMRFANEYDPASILDNSAKVYKDPDWWKKPGKGFGHDFHNIAEHYMGFGRNPVVGELPKQGFRGFDPVPDFSFSFMPGSAEEQKDPNAQFSAP
jgi:hypothetical protein